MTENSPLPAVGMVVADRYRLDAELGQGTFSDVFRAKDLRFGHEVALKLLSAASIDAAGLKRFRREAELAKKLQHANTVRLLDFDLDAKPSPYIAYEFLRGETLDRFLAREGPMSEARVAELASRLLHSLAEAHRSGIVHRDVKPENIFVCNDADTSVWIKVLDFGIAKSVGPAETQLTAAGLLIGTPRYMSPEQVRGEDPMPGMDLYAVGMLMAEALTGAPLLSCGAAEACLEQLKPENIPLPELVQSSPLYPVIRRATEKDAGMRYKYAADMIDDIDRARPMLSLTPSFRPIAPTLYDEGLAHVSEPPPPVLSYSQPVPRPSTPAVPDHMKWLFAAVVLLLVGLVLTALGAYALRAWGGLSTQYTPRSSKLRSVAVTEMGSAFHDEP